MVAKERFPRLRGSAAGRPSGLRHVLRDSILIDGMTEFRQFGHDGLAALPLHGTHWHRAIRLIFLHTAWHESCVMAPMALGRLLAGGLAFSAVACAPPVGDAGTGLHLDAGSSTGPHDTGTPTMGDGGGTTQAGDTGTPTDGKGALGPWVSTADYPLSANDCVGTAPN